MQLAQWFSVCSTWSLWHLLVVDQLHCVYFILLVIYLCFILSKLDYDNEKQIQIPRGRFAKVVQMLYKSFLPLSILLMIILHIAEAFVVPPPALPDIFPVLWVVVGCASFVAMWVASLGMLSTFLSQSKIFNEKEDWFVCAQFKSWGEMNGVRKWCVKNTSNDVWRVISTTMSCRNRVAIVWRNKETIVINLWDTILPLWMHY